MAVECGFGFIFWIERVRNKGELTNYFLKIATELGKASQIPVNAPKNFRRVRASQKLLPPVEHLSDKIGYVIKVRKATLLSVAIQKLHRNCLLLFNGVQTDLIDYTYLIDKKYKKA